MNSFYKEVELWTKNHELNDSYHLIESMFGNNHGNSIMTTESSGLYMVD